VPSRGEPLDPGKRVLVVMPAYNEQDSIAAAIAEVRATNPEVDLLVVDDGSADATAVIAEQAGVPVCRLPYNLGVGGAMRAGYRYAVRHDYDVVVQIDADGQHDPAEVSKLMAEMEKGDIDMVVGSRFLSDDHLYPAPISRRTGIHIFAFVCSRITGQKISDPTSGFRLCNRRAIELFARDYPHDYPEVEATLVLHYHRLRMREVPVQMFERGGGASSISGSGKSAYYMVKVLLAIFIGLFRARPVVEAGDAAPVAATHGI
jgi:glycosyltransferase involved in cell wall biosynthesis